VSVPKQKLCYYTVDDLENNSKDSYLTTDNLNNQNNQNLEIENSKNNLDYFQNKNDNYLLIENDKYDNANSTKEFYNYNDNLINKNSLIEYKNIEFLMIMI